MDNRQRRLGELLKKEISDLVVRDIKDPRIGFVSITSVDISVDLRHSKVRVSVLGSEDERKATLAGLRSATGFIRRELGNRLRLKYVPTIRFAYDDSIEQGARIISLIDSVVKKEDTPVDEE